MSAVLLPVDLKPSGARAQFSAAPRAEDGTVSILVSGLVELRGSLQRGLSSSFSAPAVTTLVAIPISRSHSSTDGEVVSYKYSIKSAGKLGISLNSAMDASPKAYSIISSPKSQEPNVITLIAADGKSLGLRPADNSSFVAWQKHLSEAIVDLKAQLALSIADRDEGTLDEPTIAATLSYCSLLVPSTCPHMKRMQQVLSVRRETTEVLRRVREAPKLVSLSDLTVLVRRADNEWIREVLQADRDFLFVLQMVGRLAAGEDVEAMCRRAPSASDSSTVVPAPLVGKAYASVRHAESSLCNKENNFYTHSSNNSDNNSNINNIRNTTTSKENAQVEKLREDRDNKKYNSSSSETIKRKALSPLRVGLGLGASAGSPQPERAASICMRSAALPIAALPIAALPIAALPIAAPAADPKPPRSHKGDGGEDNCKPAVSIAAGAAAEVQRATAPKALLQSATVPFAPTAANLAPEETQSMRALAPRALHVARPPPLQRPSMPPPRGARLAAHWRELLALLAIIVVISAVISAVSLNILGSSLINSIPQLEELHLVKGEALLASLADARRPLQAGESKLSGGAVAARVLESAPKFGSYYIVRVPVIKAAIKKILNIIAFIPNQLARFFFRM